MSQNDVLAVVADKWRASSGVTSVYQYGAPDGGVMVGDIPAAVLDVIDSDHEQLTMTTGGTWRHDYEIRMTLYLGVAQSDSLQVKQRALEAEYVENVAAAFQADPRLLDDDDEPTCTHARLSNVTKNFDDYRGEGKPPVMQWRLFVLET